LGIAVENQIHLKGQLEERTGYFPMAGAHLYAVLRAVQDPGSLRLCMRVNSRIF